MRIDVQLNAALLKKVNKAILKNTEDKYLTIKSLILVIISV